MSAEASTTTSENTIPKQSILTESTIEKCLYHFEYSDALTLAEVYYDQTKTDAAALLFSRALYYNKFPLQAYEVLHKIGPNNPEIRYFTAKLAYELKKVSEAERLLRANTFTNDLHSSFSETDQLPFAHSLLANILKESGKIAHSARQYQKSIIVAPLLWSNVKNYCDLGGQNIKPALHGYDVPYDPKLSKFQPEETIFSLNDSGDAETSSSPGGGRQKLRKSPSKITRRRANTRVPEFAYNTRSKVRNSSTHRKSGSKFGTPQIPAPTPPERNRYIESQKYKLGSRRIHHGPPLSSVNKGSLSGSNTALDLITKTDSESEPMDVENYEPQTQQVRQPLVEIEHEPRSEDYDYVYEDILGYIIEMTGIQVNLSQYNFNEAMNALNQLTDKHASLPLSLELRGRVLFEKSDFIRASATFEEMHQQYPHKIEGLEVYSSCLWQLQKIPKLSGLTKELTERFRHRSETWCVAGNLYNLEKQCAIAVDCFDRATRLVPKFGYSYYLLGNELIEVGQLDRAEQAFHESVRYSPHDYRPHLGLGIIEQKRSKMSKALTHMRMAVQRNPSNIILQCHLAVVEQANGHEKEALKILNEAIKMEPNSIAARFHRARILFDSRMYTDARQELHELKELSPNEPHVFFLLGRVYKKLGDQAQAQIYFNYSSQIDPRGEQSRGFGSDQPYDELDDMDAEATAARLIRS
uniref:Tetratricopeptide repeat protein n=2 Tax=Panagrolaimus sp. PS1159 TaxID=55785 RepID=A0AC35FZ75_9BILA